MMIRHDFGKDPSATYLARHIAGPELDHLLYNLAS